MVSRGVAIRRFSTGLDMAELGARIRSARLGRGLSLDAITRRAGVSRSMLSAVERGGKVPTVLILETSIARLLGEERAARVVVLRHAAQDVARDHSGWERRILSPVLPGVEFELMRTTIAPGVDAGVFAPHARGSREYLAMERGTLQLTIDGTPYTLRAGDSAYYAGDCHHQFVNPGREPCVYYLAMELVEGDPHIRRGRALPAGPRRRP
jgi:mannose-6-phosphate isomerase-like protein (cupin superfamily)